MSATRPCSEFSMGMIAWSTLPSSPRPAHRRNRNRAAAGRRGIPPSPRHGCWRRARPGTRPRARARRERRRSSPRRSGGRGRRNSPWACGLKRGGGAIKGSRTCRSRKPHLRSPFRRDIGGAAKSDGPKDQYDRGMGAGRGRRGIGPFDRRRHDLPRGTPRKDGLCDRRRGGRGCGRRCRRGADRLASAHRRRGQGRRSLQEMRRMPHHQPGWRERYRSQSLCHAGRGYRARQSGLCLLRRAEGGRRPMGLGQDERVADVPTQVRARHEDDLCRSLQSTGPRERDPVPQPAGIEPAAARRSGGQGGTGGGRGPANAADAAVNKVEADPRADTGSIANTGTPAKGAPSVDPQAAIEGAKAPR